MAAPPLKASDMYYAKTCVCDTIQGSGQVFTSFSALRNFLAGVHGAANSSRVAGFGQLRSMDVDDITKLLQYFREQGWLSVGEGGRLQWTLTGSDGPSSSAPVDYAVPLDGAALWPPSSTRPAASLSVGMGAGANWMGSAASAPAPGPTGTGTGAGAGAGAWAGAGAGAGATAMRTPMAELSNRMMLQPTAASHSLMKTGPVSVTAKFVMQQLTQRSSGGSTAATGAPSLAAAAAAATAALRPGSAPASRAAASTPYAASGAAPSRPFSSSADSLSGSSSGAIPSAADGSSSAAAGYSSSSSSAPAAASAMEHPDVDDTSSLSREQLGVYEMVTSGHSVFFTGSAGTGKSHLLRMLIRHLKRKHAKQADAVYVTAPTGIAACNIGGVTIHSFAGLTKSDGSAEQLAAKVERQASLASRWRNARVLVIDEVSMLDGFLFETLEYVARRVRAINQPFGGIQLVLAGDFFQLPPIGDLQSGPAGGSGGYQRKGGDDRKAAVKYCFDAKCWNECLRAQMNLQTVFRQKDQQLIDLLNRTRVGNVGTDLLAVLNTAGADLLAQMREDPAFRPTKLFSRNADVDAVNNAELSKCTGARRVFKARDTGAEELFDQLRSSCPAATDLELRVGAQVMLLKNLDTERGLVNGARGTIDSFVPNPDASTSADALPMLPVLAFRRPNGEHDTVPLGRADWTVELGTTKIATRSQIPLKLAYALSIHKSQGMTLEHLEVDLNGVFESGQAYVALSRAVALSKLRVRNFTLDKVKVNPRVKEFYRALALGHKLPPLGAPPNPQPALGPPAAAASAAPPVAVSGPAAAYAARPATARPAFAPSLTRGATSNTAASGGSGGRPQQQQHQHQHQQQQQQQPRPGFTPLVPQPQAGGAGPRPMLPSSAAYAPRPPVAMTGAATVPAFGSASGAVPAPVAPAQWAQPRPVYSVILQPLPAPVVVNAPAPGGEDADAEAEPDAKRRKLDG